MLSSSSHFTDVLSSHKLSSHSIVVPHTVVSVYAVTLKYSHVKSLLYVFLVSDIHERLNKLIFISAITVGGNKDGGIVDVSLTVSWLVLENLLCFVA